MPHSGRTANNMGVLLRIASLLSLVRGSSADSADVTNPYASCSDYCIVLCWSWSVMVVVVVVECHCCIPYPDAGPDFVPCILTFAPCTCGVILLLNSVFHLHTWWWSLAATCAGVFISFHPLAHIFLHLCSSNLHCVVAVCGGGTCMWMWWWWL